MVVLVVLTAEITMYCEVIHSIDTGNYFVLRRIGVILMSYWLFICIWPRRHLSESVCERKGPA
jgi:hypothetical protein